MVTMDSRPDLNEVAAYAQEMMEREFPSMGFPGEAWARRDTDGVIVYHAHWPCKSAIRILGPFNDGTWGIAFVDHPANRAAFRAAAAATNRTPNLDVVRRERNLDLLSVRCVAIEWTKHLAQPQQENPNGN